ncbi:hypothetical protein LTR78_008206 [Recurvomyces mirabilis]|uniref:Mediator of RNA polymerase II transcription subunit 18 n=1 Tax=Recurvomyces mirabilis TaxID=574656 RepID=A0AAE0TQX1_9PEZI|nr:hypothetical protein LTR78_008206 [Recurvomyces mirabilis]KAK5156492.1 hypothetical protein LTS14_004703 [Recurvomyces mirabilis]
MQELILYSHIPPTRHAQVLQILAGITASRPTPTLEQTLLYIQPPATLTGAAKKAQANRQTQVKPQKSTYVKLIRDVQNDGDKTPWTLRTEEVPQAGITNVISRTITERLLSDQDLEAFRQTTGNKTKYCNQFLASPGHRFIHNNLIIRISRILTVPDGTGALEPLDAPVPEVRECRVVDSSGAYLFEVTVRVEDGANSKLVEMGMGEILGFRRLVEGVVDLRVPERLALDSRIK